MKKQPKQERSRQIVDAVLGGATRVLSRMRLSEVSTNRIAEVAGVGIGSVYDYFPNKNAIVIALMDRRITSITDDFQKLMESAGHRTLEQKIDAAVKFIEEEFLARQDFLREIFFLAPEAGRMQALMRGRVVCTMSIANVLREHSRLDEDQINRRAFLVMHGVMGIIESHIMIEPRLFESAELAREVRRFIRFQLLQDAD